MNFFSRLVLAGALSTTVFSALADEQAKQALQQRLNQMQQFRADFSQQVTDLQGNTVHQANGQLTMARPDKLRWQTKSPDETLLIADGRAVWNVDTFVEQVTIIEQSRAIENNPIILLTSNDSEKWQQFRITQPHEDTFTVTPKNSDSQIQQLQLVFDEHSLVALSMKDAQEQTSELKFTAIETQFTPQLSNFEVTIDDTYTIDDQR
ncbi:outer membrane lipoprotein chaperone LolA [Alteromonas lipotrueiana]|uniref:outer membrane lipoprotein chaperone LolA n=1 Tax=Alteromonas lipotrueiana TaxID=2803815 RepID=UPI001C43AD50|nr:outer membrane lipoprotein chaperone LolA [Alteromonas lipotrueiana]|tara:strand:+ start:290 stop:910 length:621 start_codon:yes stop_codon:yes gene_type:complete